MKMYSRGKWVGENTEFEKGELRNGGKYYGIFMVADDGPNYLGSIIFGVKSGKISGQCAKWYWEFSDKDLIPTEF